MDSRNRDFADIWLNKFNESIVNLLQFRNIGRYRKMVGG